MRNGDAAALVCTECSPCADVRGADTCAPAPAAKRSGSDTNAAKTAYMRILRAYLELDHNGYTEALGELAKRLKQDGARDSQIPIHSSLAIALDRNFPMPTRIELASAGYNEHRLEKIRTDPNCRWIVPTEKMIQDSRDKSQAGRRKNINKSQPDQQQINSRPKPKIAKRDAKDKIMEVLMTASKMHKEAIIAGDNSFINTRASDIGEDVLQLCRHILSQDPVAAQEDASQIQQAACDPQMQPFNTPSRACLPMSSACAPLVFLHAPRLLHGPCLLPDLPCRPESIAPSVLVLLRQMHPLLYRRRALRRSVTSHHPH